MDITELPGYVSGFPHEKGVSELGGQRTRDGRLVRHGSFIVGRHLSA
jgi:hypothetical protein